MPRLPHKLRMRTRQSMKSVNWLGLMKPYWEVLGGGRNVRRVKTNHYCGTATRCRVSENGPHMTSSGVCLGPTLAPYAAFRDKSCHKSTAPRESTVYEVHISRVSFAAWFRILYGALADKDTSHTTARVFIYAGGRNH